MLLIKKLLRLIQVIHFAQYRDNFPKSTDAWWWYLDIYDEEKLAKSHPWNRFEWWLKGVQIIIWTGDWTPMEFN